MISNADIADVIDFTGKLFTLHDLDENKARLYGGLAFGLERLEDNLAEMADDELIKVRGVGKSMLPILKEIIEKNTSIELENLVAQTPEGVLEMFKVKGLGVKKIKVLWQELGIDNLNDLQIACESGKIAETKGFGEKTQISILESLLFIRQQSGKLRMDKAEEISAQVLTKLKECFAYVEEVGPIRRRLETVDKLIFLSTDAFTSKKKLPDADFQEDMKLSSPFVWRGYCGANQLLIEIRFVEVQELSRERLLQSAERSHFNYKENGQSFFHFIKSSLFDTEEAYYTGFGSNFIVPEMREGLHEFEWIKNNDNTNLISWDHLKGCLHNHSKYSDGKNSLREMAEACKALGLEYFGIADHSQTATYANGMPAGRVVQQQAEIDMLNAEMAPFKILKGIESDILPDGGLDYEPEVLATFDYVVASVHANLDMDIEKATNRLLKAIENPYTTILGHPTGRLLLSRKGYPIDYQKIIDACAANKVVMEINASPYRLDIDWRWIPYCLEKGVMLSINPDAHKTEGFLDMHYGIAVARKAGLTRQMTFNALSLAEIETYLKSRKA